MAKVHEKKQGGPYTGTILSYANLGEYYKQLNEPILPGRNDSSQEVDRAGWSGTDTYEDAEDLMYSGDEASYQKLMELKTETDKYYISEAGTKVKPFNDVVGYTPNVPNAIMGVPESMINSRREPKRHKVLDIFVNRSRSAMTDTEQIEYEGALILSFIDALERDGYRVNLYIGAISWKSSSNEIVGHLVPIKLATESLNIKKSAYFLVSPAYLRRTVFKINENESRLPDLTNNGYGSVMYREYARNMLVNEVNDKMLIIDDSLDLDRYDDDKDNIEKLNNLFSKM